MTFVTRKRKNKHYIKDLFFEKFRNPFFFSGQKLQKLFKKKIFLKYEKLFTFLVNSPKKKKNPGAFTWNHPKTKC